MTLLSTINDVQDRIGLPRSSVVVSSTDQNVRRLLALANQEGRELAGRHTWQAIRKEHTFTSVATAAQTGSIPTDFDRFIADRMFIFNRTRKRGVAGPLSPSEWQAQQALTASVLTDAFMVRANTIYIVPTPQAGDTYAYEYVSKYWVDNDADGDGDLAAWAADTNTGVLDETLMGLGIEWRYLKSVGFDYAESFRTYEMQIEQALYRDGGRRTVSMAYDSDMLLDNHRPPTVPEGSWNL